jgi:hypothetical protein
MNFSVLKQFSPVSELAEYLRVYNDLSDGEGWKGGRRGGGYEKLLLCDSADEWDIDPFTDKMVLKSLKVMGFVYDHHDDLHKHWDCYFIRMGDGAYILPHTDPSAKGDHHRLNTMIMSCERGGIFTLEGTQADLQMGDALKFRPDLDRHEVTMVAGGCERLMFSVGCILPVE